MIKAGVIGHPIAHSKSPLIHDYWLNQYGVEGEYKTYDIDSASLESGVRTLVDAGLVGFNVTLPHKQNIIPLCKTLSDEARLIGAVNTVTISSAGDLHGHNTDAFGFAQNLKVAVPDFDFKNATATVIGAGGAARAVLYALRQNGISTINITNRTRESADLLAIPYQATVVDWDDRNDVVRDVSLVVNTTSLGMKGQKDLDIDLSGIHGDAVVYDIVYIPLMTDLLKQAEKQRVRIVTGVGMLLHQARPGFEAWFGHFPDVTPELESLILGIK